VLADPPLAAALGIGAAVIGGALVVGAALGFDPAEQALDWAADKVSDIFSKDETKEEDEDPYSKPIEIAPEDKIPDDELIPPKGRGKPPKDKATGKPIEIHHKDQNPGGPFIEKKWEDHRGAGQHKKNHPKRESDVDRSKWKMQREKYWREQYDSNRWNQYRWIK
jgi:hypothetical protein